MNTELIISMGFVGAMLSMLGMGLLIAYYGSSKTRNIGFVFLIVGAGLAYYLAEMGMDAHPSVSFMNGMLAFLGGMLGGIIGIIIFLVAIIKS
ncbi:hypothetical protein OAO35_03955 [Euryarchaeota archaeon]|jgi:hypothetical protein|nr:hypothetical protein [Euryarchaeota archaeon]